MTQPFQPDDQVHGRPLYLTLQDYLVPILKRRWMILGIVVVITAVVTAYGATRPKTYVASTEVYVGTESDLALGIGPTAPSTESLANQATLLTSTETAATVAKKIGYTGSPAALAASVSAVSSQTTSFVTIKASASTSAESARIANGFAQQFVASNTEDQLAAGEKQIATLRKQLKQLPRREVGERASLQQQIQQLELTASSSVGTSHQINVASGGSASSHSVIEFAILAAIGSLIGGVLLAFLLERLDPRLKGIQHTEMIYQHPVLATVWHDDGIDHFVDNKPALSPRSREAFRDLRIGLYLAVGDLDLKTVVISSAVPDEGKSTVARNLALVLAEGGRRVALVDADLRKSTLARTLRLKPGRGLADVIVGTRTLDEVLEEIPIDGPKLKVGRSADGELARASTVGHDSTTRTVTAWNLHDDREQASKGSPDAPSGLGTPRSLFFLSSGTKTENPQGVLESDGFRAVLKTLSSSFDVVVIDSTPLTLVSDAIPILREADAALLVARSSTDSRSARHASEVIQRVPGVNVVGLVVNDVPEAAAAAYGKGYGYGYYGYGYGNRYGAYGYGYVGEPEPTNGSSPQDASGSAIHLRPPERAQSGAQDADIGDPHA